MNFYLFRLEMKQKGLCLIRITTLFVLAMAVPMLITSQSKAATTLLIDPGHGGSDRGARHHNVVEAQLVLKIAQKLKDRFEKQHPSWKVELSRQEDVDLALEDRAALVEKLNPDLFLSIHANSNEDPRLKGVEVYLANSLPPDPDSLLAAEIENQSQRAQTSQGPGKKTDFSRESDVRSIVEDLKLQGKQKQSLSLGLELYRGFKQAGFTKINVKQAPFFVLTHSTRPAILLEVGFLTNSEEAQRLTTEKYQSQLIEKILHALQNYLDKKDSNRID